MQYIQTNEDDKIIYDGNSDNETESILYGKICGLKTQKKVLEAKYHEKEIKYQQQLQQQTKLIST